MYDHENHVGRSLVWNEEDSYGVYWGDELHGIYEEDEPKKKLKSIKQYASFYLHGRKYGLNDTVYLLSGEGGGPPYIGRIGKLYENVKDKEKQMHVRWFCRPCELPEGLPDVDYSENCKEVFLMWGNGAKNINNPASILRHCSVLCTADEEWNRNFPAIEEIAAADHIFDRAFDLGTRTLRSLDSIVKHYGENVITGMGGATPAPSKRRALGKSGKMTAGTRLPLDHKALPFAMRASSNLPKLKLDWQRSGFSGLPALVTSPSTPSPIPSVEGRMESFLPTPPATAMKSAGNKSTAARFTHSKATEERTIPKAANQGSKRPLVKRVKNAGTLDSQKRQRVDNSSALLPQQAQGRPGCDFPSSGVSQGRNQLLSENRGTDLRGDAILNRVEDKGRNYASGGPTDLEGKKRSRPDSPDRRTGGGKLKKTKLSIPSHVPQVALTKVTKVKDPLTAIGCKMGEVRSPRVPEGNLPENSSGWQQAHPTSTKQDSRVSSPPVGERSFNLDSKQNQMQASSRAWSMKEANAGLLFPDVVDKRSTMFSDKGLSDPKREEIHCARKQSIEEENGGLSDPEREAIHCPRNQSNKEEKAGVGPSSRHIAHPKHAVSVPNASGHQRVSEDLSPLHQNGANLKYRDTNLFVKSSSDRLESRCQPSIQDDLHEVSAVPSEGRKLSTSIQGKALTDEDVSPISKKNRLVSERNRNGTEESQVKLSHTLENLVSRKNAVARHTEVGSPQKASKKRPGSELEVCTLKSKTMRNTDPKPTAGVGPAQGDLAVKKIGLVAKGVPRVSSNKQSDETKHAETSRLSLQGLAEVGKPLVKKQRIAELASAARKVGQAAALDIAVARPEGYRREIFEPKKKIFNFPWEQTLRIALEQRKALFLRNLDPWFSSAEIELLEPKLEVTSLSPEEIWLSHMSMANLQELLQVNCDVRMLPPNNFTCYTSGQALVLFRTQNAAAEALRKFTENFVIWSNDEKPILASLADPKIAVKNTIHGFYNVEVFGSRGAHSAGEDQKNAVATSHCSQPNTVEYEMGIQWRLLQDRHTEAWTIASKLQDQKGASNLSVNKSKEKR